MRWRIFTLTLTSPLLVSSALVMMPECQHFFGVLAQRDSHSSRDLGRDIARRAPHGQNAMSSEKIDFCLVYGGNGDLGSRGSRAGMIRTRRV